MRARDRHNTQESLMRNKAATENTLNRFRRRPLIQDAEFVMQNIASGKRLLFQLVGYVFFSVGFAGMLLPVLPTTIFWIVAAACFAKSAPGMYRRILAWLGAAIEDYLERGLIGPRSKTVALTGKAIGAILIVTSPMPAYATGISLLCIALDVATRPGKLVATAPPNRSAGACAARIPSRALSCMDAPGVARGKPI